MSQHEATGVALDVVAAAEEVAAQWEKYMRDDGLTNPHDHDGFQDAIENLVWIVKEAKRKVG